MKVGETMEDFVKERFGDNVLLAAKAMGMRRELLQQRIDKGCLVVDGRLYNPGCEIKVNYDLIEGLPSGGGGRGRQAYYSYDQELLQVPAISEISGVSISTIRNRLIKHQIPPGGVVDDILYPSEKEPIYYLLNGRSVSMNKISRDTGITFGRLYTLIKRAGRKPLDEIGDLIKMELRKKP